MDTPRYHAQKGPLAALPGAASTGAAAESKDSAVGVEDVTLSLEIAELSEEQTSAVDAQLERDRAFLTSMLTVEAAKWQLVREMGAAEVRVLPLGHWELGPSRSPPSAVPDPCPSTPRSHTNRIS